MAPVRRTDPISGETRVWDGKVWVPEQAGAEPPADPNAPGKIESLGRGAIQGATVGFSDELAGAAKAIGMDPGALAVVMANPIVGPMVATNLGLGQLIRKGPSQMASDYRAGRDEARAANDAAKAANPKTYLAGQIVGGLATAVVPGMGGTTLAKAVAGGTAYGAAAGLGESKADLTKGDVQQAAVDTGIGAAAGAAGGAGGYGAGKVIGWAGRKAVDTIRSKMAGVPASQGVAVQEAAREVAKTAGEPAAAATTQTAKTFYERSMQLEKDVQAAAPDFKLFPDQAAGDRALALARSKASQFPSTMNVTQAAEDAQLRNTARYLDSIVSHVASKPEQLGKADVAAQVAGAVDRHMRALVGARSAAAAPLYKAAEESGTMVPLGPIREALTQQIEENKFAPAAITNQLKSILDKLGTTATGPASDVPTAITVAETQNLRSLLTKAVQGKATIIADMPVANQARIARNVLSSVDAALEQAAEAGGTGAKDLAKANAVWREHSKLIDETATETVARVLKMSTTDSADTMTAKLMQSSPQQIEGVFSVLDSAAPDVAKQARAQMFYDRLTKAGLPPKGESIAAELGASKFSPLKALHDLANPETESRLLASFGTDAKARAAYKQTLELLQRVSFGPGIKGSQTAPLAAQAMQEAGQQAAAASGGPAASTAFSLVRRFINSGESLAKAMSDSESIDLFHKTLRAALGSRWGKTPSAASVASLEARAAALGFVSPPASPAVADSPRPRPDLTTASLGVR